MVRQILGEYKVRNDRLRVLYQEVLGLLPHFPDFQIG